MLIKEIQECAKYLKQEHYKNRMLFLQNKIKELEIVVDSFSFF